jgi:hypothetical protein
MDRHLWRADDRPRPSDLDAGDPLAFMDRTRTLHRSDRPRRHQCADVHLCLPLV